MKVLITSDNLYHNGNFELWEELNPVGWSIDSNFTDGQNVENEWYIENDHDIIQSLNLSKLDSDFSGWGSYFSLIKSIRCAGDGQIRNNAGFYDLETFYNTITETSGTTDLSKSFIGNNISISNIGLNLIMEAELLRVPGYENSRQSEIILTQQQNSKSIETYSPYTPFRTSIQLIQCAENIKFTKLFFELMAFYGVGFTVQKYQDGEDKNWGSQEWATQTWGGGMLIDGSYGEKYHMDIAATNFEESYVTGTIDIPVIMQRSEVQYVD